MRFGRVSECADMVLSSAKFKRSASFIQKNKSFIKKLKSIGPNIEPWGTPDKKTWKSLYMLLIFTFCFLRFKYE